MITLYHGSNIEIEKIEHKSGETYQYFFGKEITVTMIVSRLNQSSKPTIVNWRTHE